ncbi:hypothetical protein GQ607_005047 [Colletotrichum asianum]|uniref:Uncharacterized protein n=1 Tax=Colletotrichum asianum TaxID=702518 RepID=A0A8H3WGY9_9PEZI|nr:hypothetical protein GQ607_005047 [Colletotrichum asianum]
MTLLLLLRGCDPSIYRRQLELHLREHLGYCPTQPAATPIHTRLYIHSHAYSVFCVLGNARLPVPLETQMRYQSTLHCLRLLPHPAFSTVAFRYFLPRH